MEVSEIVGIDPGLTSCGVFCIDPKRGEHIRHAFIRGRIPKGSRPDLASRVYSISKAAFEFIYKSKGYKVIAVEGPAYVTVRTKGGNIKPSSSMEQLARVRQAMYDMAAFFLDDFIYYEISPTRAKLSATGNGMASKETVMRLVVSRFGFSIQEQDVADAASVAIAAFNDYSLAIKEASR